MYYDMPMRRLHFSGTLSNVYTAYKGEVTKQVCCLALKKRSRTGINKKVKRYDQQLEAVTRSIQDGSRNFYLLLLWF